MLEHMLIVFRVAGMDMDACTLPPFAKIRGREDSAALFKRVLRPRVRYVQDGDDIKIVGKRANVGSRLERLRETARANVADVANKPIAFKLVGAGVDNVEIKLYTIDKSTPMGPSIDYDDEVLSKFDQVLSKFVPTVHFIAAKAKDMETIVQGGRADVVFDVECLREVATNPGIPTR